MLGDDTLMAIIERYTREAGVRQLERELGALLRHVAARVAGDKGDREADVAADDRPRFTQTPDDVPPEAGAKLAFAFQQHVDDAIDAALR